MRYRTVFASALIASCIVSSWTLAEDSWLEFRGPNGRGHTEAGDLPLTWSPSSNVAWRAALDGEGWSSPVIHDGSVYLTQAKLMDDEAKDYSLQVLKLDAKTGRLVKAVDVFHQEGSQAPKIHNKNSHASPTPLLDDGRLFVHFGHQGTAALDLDLKVLWKKQLTYPPVHGNGGTPILVNGKLIFSCDGAKDPFIVALSVDDGSVVWKTPRTSDATRKFSFCTAQAIEVNGKPQVISPGSNVVCSLDPDTGKEIWRVRYDGYSVVPRPVFANGLVYVCTGFNTPSLLAIRPDGTGDVTDTHVEWSTKTGVPHTPSLIIDGDNLFMVSDRGIATCLDAKTGKSVWKERIGGAFSASPLKAGERIYLLDEKGKTTVIAASRDFQVLGESDLAERALASFAAVDGGLFVRTDKALYRLAGN